MIIQPSRRAFIGGIAALITAPAIVRASSLMPVKAIDPYYTAYIVDYCIGMDQEALYVLRSTKPWSPPMALHFNQVHERDALRYVSRSVVRSIIPEEGKLKRVAIWMRPHDGIHPMRPI